MFLCQQRRWSHKLHITITDEGGINVAPLTAHWLTSTVALDAERATDWLRGARNKIKGCVEPWANCGSPVSPLKLSNTGVGGIWLCLFHCNDQEFKSDHFNFSVRLFGYMSRTNPRVLATQLKQLAYKHISLWITLKCIVYTLNVSHGMLQYSKETPLTGSTNIHKIFSASRVKRQPLFRLTKRRF